MSSHNERQVEVTRKHGNMEMMEELFKMNNAKWNFSFDIQVRGKLSSEIEILIEMHLRGKALRYFSPHQQTRSMGL